MPQDIHIDPVPDLSTYINTVLDRVQNCVHHPSTIDGYPCFTIPTFSSESQIFAVCDKRARKAGYVGKSSDSPQAKFHSKYNRNSQEK